MATRVTTEQALEALLKGACHVPRVGTPLEKLSFEDVLWAHNHGISTPKGTLPLWCLGKDGYGLGDGYGHGHIDGSGYGDGYSDGDGCGDGEGCGSGDGSGSVSVSAYGESSNSGDGSGYGSGYGSGCGAGDGYGNGSVPGAGDRRDLGARAAKVKAQG